MNKLFFYTAIGVVFFQSCQSGGKTTVEIPSNFNADYLFVNAKHLEKVINLEDVAGLTGVKTSDIGAYQENFSDNADSQLLLFSWEDGGNIEAGGQKIPRRSSIGFGRFEKISAADFDLKHQQKTTESLKREIERITSDETIDTDVAIWEAKELAKAAKSHQSEKLENVGNAAYWQTPIGVLHVLVNGVAFSVSANFNVDEAKNKQKAIELAQLIVTKGSIKANKK